MTEKEVKDRLIKWLEKRGWWTLLLIQTNKPGIPDVLAVDTKNQSVFIEVKRPGLKPRPLQVYRIDELNKHGSLAFVFDGDFTRLEQTLSTLTSQKTP